MSTAASSAEVPENAQSTIEKKDLKVQAQLVSSPRRHGVAAHFAPDTAYFWGCVGPCGSADEGTLSLNIPEEARSGRRRIEVVGTQDDPVLWVRWGPDERFYSVIVVGAQTKMKSAGQPRVVLKGWAGEKSDLNTSLKRDVAGGLTLGLTPKEAFCGRSVPQQTRVLRPEEGRFSTVRAPVLKAEERERAERIQGRPWSGPGASLMALEAGGEGSAQAAVDGDRSTPWGGAFEYAELRVPEGVEKGQWIVEFAAPLTEPSAFYLVAGDKIFQAEFTPAESKQYVLEVASGGDGCVAVIQPRTPAPIGEVMLAVPEAGELTTAELVSQLEMSEPGIAEAVLRLRGAEAAKELSDRFEKMSRLARVRALRIAEQLPGGLGVSVQARAVEAGGETAAQARVLLKAAGLPGSKALFERLGGADNDAGAELIAALVDIDPVFSAQHFPALLGTAQAERRDQLRQAISHLVEEQAARAVVAAWLSDTKRERKLSTAAEVELVRALASELQHLEGGMSTLGRLAESADFRRAYLLSPLVVKNFTRLKGSKVILDQWMRGEVSGKLSRQERAALSVRVLDGLLDLGTPSIRASLRAPLLASLGAENMRVRRAALFNLSRSDTASKTDVEEVLDLLLKDRWPEVRAAAALAVIPASGGELTERPERILLRRLRRDDDATVRRSIARALSSAPAPNVVAELRRAFEKDEDYSVRAEAAVSLGRLCDVGSLNALTARARQLAMGLTEEGPIELGLSSVTALAYLAPANINKRLEPLLSEKASGVTRQQVLRRIEAVRASADRDLCRR